MSHDNREQQEAFIAAVEAGNLARAETLLDDGVDVNAPNASPYTALEHAATWGHVDVVRMLLRRGAKGVDLIRLAANNAHGGVLALLLALDAYRNEVDVAGFCLCRGYTQDYPTAAFISAFNVLREHGLDLNNTDRAGSTMAEAAAACGNVAILQAIMETGYDIGLANSALPCAARKGRDECVRLLLRYGADVNHDTGASLFDAVEDVACEIQLNQQGWASDADQLARTVAERTNLVQELISAGANPALRDYGAARKAAMWGLVDIVAVFLRAGVPALKPIGVFGDGEGHGHTLRAIAVLTHQPQVVACIDAYQQAQALARPHDAAHNNARSEQQLNRITNRGHRL